MSRTKGQLLLQGAAAFHGGRRVYANPYMGTQSSHWRTGWLQGQVGTLPPGEAPTPTQICTPAAAGRRRVRRLRQP